MGCVDYTSELQRKLQTALAVEHILGLILGPWVRLQKFTIPGTKTQPRHRAVWACQSETVVC